MEEKHIQKIAAELSLATRQVQATADLLSERATIPFIARYRKEATGSLDELAVTAIRDRMEQLEELDKRREAILKSLEEREILTDELKEKILAAETMSSLEDLYLPFRPKRRTRATVAREKGLEPLARFLWAQEDGDPPGEAVRFIDAEKGVADAEEALAGARDIVAEWVSEDLTARAELRTLFATRGIFRSKVISGRETEGSKYRDYFDWEEPGSSAPSHRILAMRRGEKEEILSMTIRPPEAEALAILERLFVKGDRATSSQVNLSTPRPKGLGLPSTQAQVEGLKVDPERRFFTPPQKAGLSAAEWVKMAVQDSYVRLLSLSMETEARLATKKRADEEAIRVFADNLRQLLLAPPLGQKNILAIDPGFRTGCKVVCLDRQGKLLHHETIYPLLSEEGKTRAAERIRNLCEQFEVEAIAVGNGTGGRETEGFVRGLQFSADIQVVMVNESGASIYSASKVAREEFPDADVTVRGSVSIGRRLMDPLAELVKIDPKSIGVGQYQHDVDQGALKRSLDEVVMSCVNAVGVEVNTASPQLLTYVSGLGPQLASNILAHRNANGPFRSREELKKVPRLGARAFEQAAGFLRIRGGDNPLDASAVHPESYPVVQAMARDLGCTVADLMREEKLRKEIEVTRYVTEKAGIPTLNDILKELAKPGRDPRQEFESFRFAEGIEKIEDLQPGMKIAGIVTNITAFGAFVDIGVHQDGLVHVSQLADRFVKDPHQVVKVHQKVEVTVLAVDKERKRISLSMKKNPESNGGTRDSGPKGTVRKKFGKTEEKNPPFNNPFARAFRRQDS